MRTGDTVYHRPSGEQWLVAAVWPEQDALAWCGWPEGRARMSDCNVVRRCADVEHWELVERIAESNGMRARYCQQLLATHAPRPTPATPAAASDGGRVTGRGIGSVAHSEAGER